jgi:hypothetical protein
VQERPALGHARDGAESEREPFIVHAAESLVSAVATFPTAADELERLGVNYVAYKLTGGDESEQASKGTQGGPAASPGDQADSKSTA